MVHPAPVRPEDWLRFIHLDPFAGQWHRLKLGDEDLRALEVCIMASPDQGAVVSGAGGLRKVRFTAPGSGKGKSGSYRVFYVSFPDHGHVVLWAIIAKGERENLTKADRNAIAKQIERLKGLLDKGVIR